MLKDITYRIAYDGSEHQASVSLNWERNPRGEKLVAVINRPCFREWRAESATIHSGARREPVERAMLDRIRQKLEGYQPVDFNQCGNLYHLSATIA